MPTRADVPARLESIAVGEWHACGLDPAGIAWCWGNDVYGELGTEVRGRADTAVAVGGPWQALEAGGHHTCAIDLESAVWCWGGNQFGQSGGEPREPPRRPRPVPQALPLRALALGATMTCGLDGAGAAWCWGRGASAGPTSGPVPVPGVGPLRSIDAAGTRACGVDREEGTRCWSGVPREAGSVEEMGGTVLAAGVFKGGTCGVAPGGVTCRTPGAGAWPAALLFMGPLLGVLVVGYERGWVPGWLMATATAAVTAATAVLLVPLVGFWHALATDETGWFFIMELGALVGIIALVAAYVGFLGMVGRAWRIRQGRSF